MARIKEPYVHIQERVRETPTLLNIDGSTNIGGVVVSPKGKRYQYIEGPKDFLEKLVGAEELPRDSHVSLINAYYCSYFAGLVVARALNTNATGGLMIYLDDDDKNCEKVKLINGSILNKTITHSFSGLDKIGWAFFLHGILFYCLEEESQLDTEVLYLYPELASATKVNCKSVITRSGVECNDESYAVHRIKDAINSLEGITCEFSEGSLVFIEDDTVSNPKNVDSLEEAKKKEGNYRYPNGIDPVNKVWTPCRYGSYFSAQKVDKAVGDIIVINPEKIKYDENGVPTLESVIYTVNTFPKSEKPSYKDKILRISTESGRDATLDYLARMNDSDDTNDDLPDLEWHYYQIKDSGANALYVDTNESSVVGTFDSISSDKNKMQVDSLSSNSTTSGDALVETVDQNSPIYYYPTDIQLYVTGKVVQAISLDVCLNDNEYWSELPDTYLTKKYTKVVKGTGEIPTDTDSDRVKVIDTLSSSIDLNHDYLLVACTETLGYESGEEPFSIDIKKLAADDPEFNNQIFKLSISAKGKKAVNYTVSLNPNANYDGVNCFIENYNPQLKDYQFILNVSDTFDDYEKLPVLSTGFGYSGFDRKMSVDPSYFSTAIYKLGEQEEFQIEYLSDFGYTDTTYLKDYIYVGKNHWWFTPVSIPFSYTNAAVMENFGNGIASNNNTIIIGPFDKNSTFLGFPAKIAPTSKYYERVFANKANGAEYAPLFEETNGVLTYVNPSAMIDATGRVALLNASSGPINFLVYNQRNNQYYFNDNRCHTTDNNVMSEEMNRRMINRINKDVKVLMNRMKGRVNSNTTRQLVQDLIDLYMSQNIYTQQYKPVEHQIVCDETNNGDAIIAANQLQVTLRIRLYGSIKFIDVLDDIFPLGVDFEASLS